MKQETLKCFLDSMYALEKIGYALKDSLGLDIWSTIFDIEEGPVTLMNDQTILPFLDAEMWYEITELFKKWYYKDEHPKFYNPFYPDEMEPEEIHNTEELANHLIGFFFKEEDLDHD